MGHKGELGGGDFDAADERAETSRFEALHELERSYGDVNRAMDDIESKCAWERLEPLRMAAHFAQGAAEAAETLARGLASGELLAAASGAPRADAPAADGLLHGGRDGADAAEAAAGGGGHGAALGGVHGAAALADGGGDDDDDDELEHLSQMVAQANRRSRYRAGGGGGRRRGPRGGKKKSQGHSAD